MEIAIYNRYLIYKCFNGSNKNRQTQTNSFNIRVPYRSVVANFSDLKNCPVRLIHFADRLCHITKYIYIYLQKNNQSISILLHNQTIQFSSINKT